MDRLRLGRIGYTNVLPIYLPLEAGEVPGFDPAEYEIVSGPPATLNDLAAKGLLDVSAVSSIEYGRRPGDYWLLPDLAIGSRGPVQSVLLLSEIPIEALSGRSILVSAETHTSAMLLKLLMRDHLGLDVRFVSATSAVEAGREAERAPAVLAIGDEALRMRRGKKRPHRLDLGELWTAWTGLPFIFGVWVAARRTLAERPLEVRRAAAALVQAKRTGLANLDGIVTRARKAGFGSAADLRAYFNGLVYDLGPEEQAGLTLFFRKLEKAGLLPKAPALEFLP